MRAQAGRDEGGTGFRYDEDDDEPPRRPRREEARSSPGLIGRTFRLVRLLVFVLPLLLLMVSFLVDCRDRSGTGLLAGLLPGIVRSSACARQDLTGHLSSLEDTMRTISRAIR